MWEGKRTVPLLHLMRTASFEDREEVRRILELSRPPDVEKTSMSSDALLQELVDANELTEAGRTRLVEASASGHKTVDEIELVMSLMRRHGSIEYARDVARRWTEAAQAQLEKCSEWMVPSVHRSLLEELVAYVYARVR